MAEAKKRVPKRRFKEFRNGEDWEVCKLDQIVDIVMGQSPDGSTYTDIPSDHILVQGNADLKNGWVSPRIWTTQVTKKANAGDLIMSVRAPAGEMGKTAYNVVLGRGVAAIKGNEFVFQSLLKMNTTGYWRKLSSGSTFDSINSDNIRNAELFIPTQQEQNRIGVFFKNLDTLITLHQRKLDKIKSTKKAYLSEMFPAEGESKPKRRFKGFSGDWELCEFEEIFKVSQGLQIPISERFINPSIDRYFYITNEFLKSGCDVRYYIYNPSKNVICNREDILMTRTGNTGIVVTDIEGCFHNNFFKIKYNKQNFDKHFICQFLSSEKMQKRILNSAGSSTIPDLSHSSFYKLDGFFPKIKEQQKISRLLLNLDNLITLHQQKLDNLKHLKKSYLNEMFI